MKWIKGKKRQITQVICTILYNCNFTGFMEGKIYKGNVKMICVPGLNCYSCPGAVASCPLGSLQSALITSRYRFPYYILGMLLLFGAICGRVVCGFLCPFGWFQELLYKIPTRKIAKGKWSRGLSYAKYLILVIFVIIIPILTLAPGFCKYICPAGTLEAGIPLTVMNEQMLDLTGSLFVWKVFLLIVCASTAIFVFRSFCRFICPLGAFYSLFNKIAFIGMHIDSERCTQCGKCVQMCKMDVKKVGDKECIHCGECISHCPECALKLGCYGLTLPCNKSSNVIPSK